MFLVCAPNLGLLHLYKQVFLAEHYHFMVAVVELLVAHQLAEVAAKRGHQTADSD
jgi:hypothetical protein